MASVNNVVQSKRRHVKTKRMQEFIQAQDENVVQSKRRHVKTKRMQEFIQAQDEASSPTKKLKCPEPWCNKVFTSAPGLKYHLMKHCERLQEFTCRRCSRVFKSANGLKYHREKSKCDDSDFLQNQTRTKPSTIQSTRGHIPKPLELSYEDDDDHDVADDDDCVKSRQDLDNLTKLAIIATSPQSPLMQRHKPPWDIKPSVGVVRSLNKMLNKWEDASTDSESESTPSDLTLSDSCVFSDGCDPHVSASSPLLITREYRPQCIIICVFSDGCDPHVSTSSPLLMTPEEEIGSSWSHKWPTAVWLCFIKDTKVQFTGGDNTEWHLVQTLAQKEELAQQASIKSTVQNSYGADGLTIKSLSQPDDGLEIVLHFSPNSSTQSDLVAICEVDHPFFVKDKGWSSNNPCRTVTKYGIPCNDLSVGDVCLPPNHPDAAFTEEIFRGLEEFDFTPEDTSAVLALSSMKQRRDSDQSPKAGSGSTVLVKQSREDGQAKAKRPMNAFMLFAQEFRLGYTKKFPKKDNRAISIILGEQWKSLSTQTKQHYEEKARALADRQKKMHPDCWKRKK